MLRKGGRVTNIICVSICFGKICAGRLEVFKRYWIVNSY